ncbi:MAG: M23 family metallopeptidase [Bacteroidales bacterium]|nr:M23 family metallopeptidase [Bacteroidales bacterium]
MARKKYIFNTQTHDYEEYKPSFGKRLRSFCLFFILAGFIGIIGVSIIYNTLGTPKERMQAREIEFLQLQFEILNKKISRINHALDEMQDRDDNIYRMIFESDPIPPSVREGGYGGADRYTDLEGYDNSATIKATAKKIDILESQLNVQAKSFDEVYEMAVNKADMLKHIPAIMPVRNVDINRISSHFGHRTDPFYKIQKFHSGIDFSAPVGTKIYCTGDGVVEKVVLGNSGYGNYVIVNHGYGYKTRYAHLKKALVKKGQKVSRGENIALMGNTGKSTAPHLHYEVIKNDKPINPINFFYNDLTPEEYEQILKLSERPSMTMD